jgi:very-short-patch-repair endonuclease
LEKTETIGNRPSFADAPTRKESSCQYKNVPFPKKIIGAFPHCRFPKTVLKNIITNHDVFVRMFSPSPKGRRDEGDKNVFPLPRWEGMKGRGESTVGVKGLTGVARRLRKTSTDTERQLWRHLRDRQLEGFKFRRQQPVGRYVVDFVSLEEKVIVEVDGGQHALDPGDQIRDEWLRSEGYQVLRFWNNQVLNNMEGVLETIRNALLTPHPDPLPQGERGDNF